MCTDYVHPSMLALFCSHDLHITDFSTFGSVAAGLSGRIPYTMNIVKYFWGTWQENGRPVCDIASPEPCFHSFPGDPNKLQVSKRIHFLKSWFALMRLQVLAFVSLPVPLCLFVPSASYCALIPSHLFFLVMSSAKMQSCQPNHTLWGAKLSVLAWGMM